MLNDLTVFQKTYELILCLYPMANKFPKSQRFVLAQRIENSALNILEYIIIANNEFNKENALRKASVELEKLRIFIRLAKDLSFISFKKYEYVSKLINEVGKLLGGWIKSQSL